MNQPFLLKVLEASSRALGVVADVVKVALGDDSKRPDRCQRAALGTVDLVDTVALPNRSPLASTWEVEILREHVTRVAFPIPIAIARTAAATKVAVPAAATIAIVAWIVSVPHASSSWIQLRALVPPGANHWKSFEYEQRRGETAIHAWVLSGGVRCCRSPRRLIAFLVDDRPSNRSSPI
jgi:hypothetical protein